MRNDQLDFQESLQQRLSQIEERSRQPKKAPALESKSLSKQQEFNVAHIAELEDLKNLISTDSAKALEKVDTEIAKFRLRNNKLLLADKFPGSLSVLESLQELSELKKDPDCAPFLVDVLQLTARSGRGSQAFGGGGRGRGTPGAYQQPQFLPQSPVQFPAIGSAPYYAQNQGLVLSGNRAPRTIVGPCNFCSAYGHLQRNCELYKRAAESAQRGQSVSSAVGSALVPSPALAWPTGGSFQPQGSGQ
ncbi:MAG: hypothetical protein GY927_24245 [bacterium]|nr:hypothetical protein [bacterium]